MPPRNTCCAALCLAAALAASPVWAAAERVVVLVGGRGRAYDEAAAGARARIERARPGAVVEVAALDTAHPRQADAWVVLGEAALQRAVDEGIAPFVAGLVVDTAPIPRDRATAVSLEFSTATQLDWIQRALPEARNLGVLYDPQHQSERVELARREAERRGLVLSTLEVRSRSDLMPALRTLARRVDALWALPDTTVYSAATLEPILAHAYANKLPVIGLSSAWVKAGAYAAPERDYRDIGEQCGEQALKLLRGTAPSQLPIEAPREFRYTLNRRAADYLRIALPADVVARASQVVE
jgi:putative ABC transport system substrate-binding protein